MEPHRMSLSRSRIHEDQQFARRNAAAVLVLIFCSAGWYYTSLRLQTVLRSQQTGQFNPATSFHIYETFFIFYFCCCNHFLNEVKCFSGGVNIKLIHKGRCLRGWSCFQPVPTCALGTCLVRFIKVLTTILWKVEWVSCLSSCCSDSHLA